MVSNKFGEEYLGKVLQKILFLCCLPKHFLEVQYIWPPFILLPSNAA